MNAPAGSTAAAALANPPWKVWAERVLRWALGLVFVYAAYSKIFDPAYFAEEVSYYHMLDPMWKINWMAIFLPWLELVCGICLLLGFASRGAMLLVIGMLIVFAYAIAHAVSEGRDIRCGCFGHGESARRVGIIAIIEDIAMLAAGMVSLWLQRRPKTTAVNVGATTTSRPG